MMTDLPVSTDLDLLVLIPRIQQVMAMLEWQVGAEVYREPRLYIPSQLLQSGEGEFKDQVRAPVLGTLPTLTV